MSGDSEQLPLLDDHTPGPEGTLGRMGLAALTLNFIFGAGVVGIPYAFEQGGLVVSVLTLGLCAMFALMSMLWLVEVQSRGQAWVLARQADAYSGIEINAGGSAAAPRPLTLPLITDSPRTPALRGSGHMQYTLGKECIELSSLTGIFLSKTGQRVYTISLMLYMLSASWAYGAITSVSFAETFPLTFITGDIACNMSQVTGALWLVPTPCWMGYLVYLFGFLVVILILMSLKTAWMQRFQMCLTLYGLSMIFAMIFTAAIALPEHFDAAKLRANTSVIFNFKGFGTVFGSFVFSQLVHMGVPTLTHVAKDKGSIKSTFVVVISFACVLYMSLGILSVLLFDSLGENKIEKVITLNWADYTAGGKHKAFARVLSNMIRLFPVATCSAGFALYALTLSNSLFQVMPESVLQWRTFRGKSGERRLQTVLKTMCIVLPCSLAAILSNVAIIMSVVGLSGFVIAYFTPLFLQLRSQEMCQRKFGSSRTPYDSFISSPTYCYACLAFASLSLLYSIYNLF